MGLTITVGGHEVYIDVPTYISPLFGVNIAVSGFAQTGNPDVETIARREQGDTGHEHY